MTCSKDIKEHLLFGGIVISRDDEKTIILVDKLSPEFLVSIGVEAKDIATSEMTINPVPIGIGTRVEVIVRELE